MTIVYLPLSGFIINSISFNWSDSRESIRAKLYQQHKSDDKVIDVAQFFDGDESQNIHEYRDIYENYNATESYFFLSYDEHGLLSEVEIHSGIKIKLYEQVLEFDSPIDVVLAKLSPHDHTFYETDKGNYLFPKLNMSLATSEAMGGEGNGLAYFYAAKDIAHLIG